MGTLKDQMWKILRLESGLTLIELMMTAAGSAIVLLGAAEVLNSYVLRTTQMDRANASFNPLKDAVDLLRKDLKIGQRAFFVDTQTLDIQVTCINPQSGALVQNAIIEYKVDRDNQSCVDLTGNPLNCYQLTRTAYRGLPFQLRSEVHRLVSMNWCLDQTLPDPPNVVNIGIGFWQVANPRTCPQVGPVPDTNLPNKRFIGQFEFLTNSVPAAGTPAPPNRTIFFAVDLENQSIVAGRNKTITTLCNIGG